MTAKKTINDSAYALERDRSMKRSMKRSSSFDCQSSKMLRATERVLL
jgi:hypothetical protein